MIELEDENVELERENTDIEVLISIMLNLSYKYSIIAYHLDI